MSSFHMTDISSSNRHISTYSSTPYPQDSIAWKTTLRKHFNRTRGWCPLGNNCKFIHDLSLHGLEYKSESSLDSVQKVNNAVYSGGNKNVHINLGPRSHCWAYVQGAPCRLRRCRYAHPTDVQPYVRYTPCPQWQFCYDKESCSYRHPKISPSLKNMPANSTLQPVAYNAPLELNGTTYYPLPLYSLELIRAAQYLQTAPRPILTEEVYPQTNDRAPFYDEAIDCTPGAPPSSPTLGFVTTTTEGDPSYSDGNYHNVSGYTHQAHTRRISIAVKLKP